MGGGVTMLKDPKLDARARTLSALATERGVDVQGVLRGVPSEPVAHIGALATALGIDALAALDLDVDFGPPPARTAKKGKRP